MYSITSSNGKKILLFNIIKHLWRHRVQSRAENSIKTLSCFFFSRTDMMPRKIFKWITYFNKAFCNHTKRVSLVVEKNRQHKADFYKTFYFKKWIQVEPSSHWQRSHILSSISQLRASNWPGVWFWTVGWSWRTRHAGRPQVRDQTINLCATTSHHSQHDMLVISLGIVSQYVVERKFQGAACLMPLSQTRHANYFVAAKNNDWRLLLFTQNCPQKILFKFKTQTSSSKCDPSLGNNKTNSDQQWRYCFISYSQALLKQDLI